jgi:hypothetical protein
MESLARSARKQTFVYYTNRRHIFVGLFFILLSILLVCSEYASGFEIVRDGKATTVIVIPDKAIDCVQRAAEELQYNVKEASDATLEIIRESAMPQTNQGCIYLGVCEATKRTGIITDKLTHNGFIIKTAGSDLFLAGRDTDGSWRENNWPQERGTLLAVYYFLDNHMGVRWLWPGKLGEVIPKTSDIIVNKLDKTVALPMISSRFGAPQFDVGWSNKQSQKQFAENEDLWMNRQFFYWNTSASAYHSFEKYWERFHKSHPEYFNMLPDGTRRFDLHYTAGGSPEYISMCISEPNLWKQIIEDWKATRTKDNPNIYISENDTAGRCCCSKCMSWDVPDPELNIPWNKRLEYAKRDFANESDGWYNNLL